MYTPRGRGFQPVPHADTEDGDLGQMSSYDRDMTYDNETMGRSYDDESRGPAQQLLRSERSALASGQLGSRREVGTTLHAIHEDEEAALTQFHDNGYRSVDASNGRYNHTRHDSSASSSETGADPAPGTEEDEWNTSYKGATGFVQEQKHMPNYKPVVFRVWFLGILILVLLAALAMMELAVHRLPDGTKSAKPVEVVKNTTDLRAREATMGPEKRSGLLAEFFEHNALFQRRQNAPLATTITPIKSTSTTLLSRTGTSTTPSISSITTPLTPDRPGPVTCTVTITEIDFPDFPDPSTVTVPTLTVTITPGGSAPLFPTQSTPRASTPSTTLAPSFQGTQSCDFTVTEYETIPIDMTTAPEDYITVGRNTVTVFLPDPKGSEKEKDRNGQNNNMPEEPPSICYLTTVTVTDRADFVVATETVTVEVTAAPGGVAARDAAAPTADAQAGRLEARACKTSGTFTFTKHIAMPKTVTVTVTRTVAGQVSKKPAPGKPGSTSAQPEKPSPKPEPPAGESSSGPGEPEKPSPKPAPAPEESSSKPDNPEKSNSNAGRPGKSTDGSVVVIPPTTSTTLITSEGKTITRITTIPPITTHAPKSTRRNSGSPKEDEDDNALPTLSTTRFTSGGKTFTSVKTIPPVTTDKSQQPASPKSTTRRMGAFSDEDDSKLPEVSLITISLDVEDDGEGSATRTKSSKETNKVQIAVISTTDARGEKTVITTTRSLSAESAERTSLTSMFTVIPTVLSDSKGRPTLTTSVRVFALPATTTLTNSLGRPTKTETYFDLNYPHTTTFFDSEGDPSTTVTYYVITSSKTFTDADGRPRTTSVTLQTKTEHTTTRTNSEGEPIATEVVLAFAQLPTPLTSTAPTPTPTGGSDADSTVFEVYSISQFQYFAGLMLPTIIATILTIPFRILDHVVRLYHPFHILASSRNGASAEQSLCWETTGLWTFVTRFQAVFQGQFLLLITGSLVMLSTILVPISAETIRVILQGEDCRPGQGNAKNCAITVGVFPIPAHIAVGVLGVLAILVIVVFVALRRYRTGVYNKPWSLSEMAILSMNPGMEAMLNRIPHRDGQIRRRELIGSLGTHSYVLGFWQDGPTVRYGVVPVDPVGIPIVAKEGAQEVMAPIYSTRSKSATEPYALTIWARALALFLLVSLLIVTVVYNAMPRSTALGRFLSSETVGLRIFITSIGIIITLFWSSYFYSIAFISPYRVIQSNPNKLRDAVNMTLSTNSFSGLFRALTPSGRDLYLAAVAFTAILAEFLPALLSNMPYKVIQTWLAHMVCTWMTVGILGMMIGLIATSFFIDWPTLPVDPGTVVGAMYYTSRFSSDPHRYK